MALTQTATVLATVRTGEVLPDPVLSLWKDGPAERIEIGVLDDATIEELLASALGGPVDAATVRELATRSRLPLRDAGRLRRQRRGRGDGLRNSGMLRAKSHASCQGNCESSWKTGVGEAPQGRHRLGGAFIHETCAAGERSALFCGASKRAAGILPPRVAQCQNDGLLNRWRLHFDQRFEEQRGGV